MLNRILISVTCLAFAASLCQAGEKKQIKLKNGETVVGEIVEKTPEGIKVKGKIATVFYPAADVVAIEDVYDVKQDYADRLAKLKKDDFDSQLALGRWALGKEMYAEAVKHLGAAVKLKNDERAKLLLRQAKRKLDESTRVSSPGSSSGTTNGAGGAAQDFDPEKMLTDDDVQRIRRAELGKEDRVRVVLRNKVVARFLEEVAGTGEFAEKGADVAFRRLPRAKQAWHILDHTIGRPDDPLRQDVIIHTDPGAMRTFRTSVWNQVASSCASASCHGAAKGQGGLKLWNVVGRSVNVDYTNFLILDSFRTQKGLQVIQRDNPGDSLLLQHGLPENLARYRHPKETSPVFTSKRAANYRAVENWIKSLRGPLAPDYGIKKLPPFVSKRVNPLGGLFGPAAPKKSKDDK